LLFLAVQKIITKCIYEPPCTQSNMYNKDIIKETSAYILVVVGDSNDFASRYKLVGHYLSHCVFII